MTQPSTSFWTHPNALVEAETIGAGTRVWAWSHVMKGAVVGRDCNLGEHVFVESGAVVGDRVTLKNGVQVWEGVTLEDEVFVGPNATFTNDLYPRSPRSGAAEDRYKDKSWLARTRVCRGASIGANATVVCGTEIGSFAMVGAGAVVVKSVPPFGRVAGVPARLLGYACMCGRPLPAESSMPVCSACGRAYAKQDTGLALSESSTTPNKGNQAR
jgi:acetyltransferase-like isoleucine patch superfamily enzyme